MITFHIPTIDDLWFKAAMLADEDTMSYNHASGGTIPFPKERRAPWHTRWVGNPEGKRFYRYIAVEGEFVGEAAYHYDEEFDHYVISVVVHAPHRGKGYGRKALLRLCEEARQNGISALYDHIAIDNPSISMFLGCGFEEVQRTDEYIMVKIAL